MALSLGNGGYGFNVGRTGERVVVQTYAHPIPGMTVYTLEIEYRDRRSRRRVRDTVQFRGTPNISKHHLPYLARYALRGKGGTRVRVLETKTS